MQTGKHPARDRIDRRRVLGGGLALTGLPTLAWSQDATVEPPPPLPQDAVLSANLLTRMGATVRINSDGRGLFVLDTGAERTAIAADLAKSLLLPPGPDLLVHGVTEAQTASTVQIDRLRFGGQRFNDLTCPTFERTVLGADGLLGLDVLSQFRLSLDLVRGRVSLVPSGNDLTVNGYASVTPTRLPGRARTETGRFGQLILLNTSVDGVPTSAFIDSGAQYSIGNLALARAAGVDLSAGRTLVVYGVTGQTGQARTGAVSDLRVAHGLLGPTPLLFSDLHAFEALGLADRPALLLGADVLYRFQRIVLDYGRGRMGFGPLRRFYAPPVVTG